MHIMEDVREGSDVPGAQPSSPGHAEQGPDLDNAKNPPYPKNGHIEPDDPKNDSSEDSLSENSKTNNENSSKDAENKDEKEDSEEKNKQMEEDCEAMIEKEIEMEVEGESNSMNDDNYSNDDSPAEGPFNKRKSDSEEPVNKKLRTDIQQNYILRDKILNEFMDSVNCTTPDQIQMQIEQTFVEIRTLNELALEKEKEWNNIVHLKKVKEELLLRMQRRKQVMLLTADRTDWAEWTSSPESQVDGNDEKHRNNNSILCNQSILKHDARNLNNEIIISANPMQVGKHASNSVHDMTSERLSHGRHRNLLPKPLISNGLEINGQLVEYKQTKQRPVLDVQSIIADYRQRHPETVPRRGRRIRSNPNQYNDPLGKLGPGTTLNFASLALGSGSQVKQNANVDVNSELGLLLGTLDGSHPRPNGSRSNNVDGHLHSTSFKDVLIQFAKLSQNEKQELLQSAMKPPPPYPEVTVHPVPTTTQSSSNSLLHGILTKTAPKPDSKATFSPTLARLLTAPERAATSSPQVSTTTAVLNPGNVSISDILSNNKARNEITITPVGGQFAPKGKAANHLEEEEAEDSADRLVIDESEALDVRKTADNGSDAGDEVPQCQGCNQKPAQFVCAGCGNQWYCSKDCQVSSWDEHSEVCSG